MKQRCKFCGSRNSHSENGVSYCSGCGRETKYCYRQRGFIRTWF